MATERPSVARTGRDTQLYRENGARVVAGTVVLNTDHTKTLLISSTKPGFWVIPKGGVETDESGPEESALRETWEEGGVVGKIVKFIGTIEDSKPPKRWVSEEGVPAPPRSEFHFWEFEAEKLEDEWPEKHKRERKWVGYQEAVDELLRNDRPELKWAVENSSLKR